MAVFVVTYNPTRWAWGAQRQQWQRRTAAGHTVRGRWSLGVRTSGIAPQQDRVFLLRQGPGPRGIIASGTFVSEAYSEEHWDENRPGEFANYADVRWDLIVSDEDRLPLADIAAQVTGLPWQRLQGSGARLPPPGDAGLERLWARHVGRTAAGLRRAAPAGRRPSRRQGWQQDPAKRRAIEDHGQRLLEQHYRDQGWIVKDVRHGNHFDAVATKEKQTLYLEAKGTESDGLGVRVSRHEVEFARAHGSQCVLGIVKNIRFYNDGALDETSGDLEIHDWNPDSGKLVPTGYDWHPACNARNHKKRRAS